MEFRLLGPVEAVRDGRSVPLGGAKPRALLALLLMHANEVVSRDRLIDALWGDRPPGTAGHSLDVQVSRLRRAFGSDEILVTRSGGYVLEVEPESIDVRRFERLLEEARKANAVGRASEALGLLEEALALWRGDPLGDLAYEEFARTDVERLEELRLVAIEERIGVELALGHHDRLVPELEALIAKNPLRERLRGQLMLALYRSGRQAEALRVYSDTRKRLVEELGIEPGKELRELEQAILRQDPSLDLRRPAATRRRRTLAGVGALLLAGGAVALVVGLTQGGAETAQALAEPDSNVFVATNTGRLVRTTPVRDTVRVAYGEGALWSVSSTGELTRLDARTGKEVARIGLGIKPSGLAIGEGSVWVTDRNSPTLVRIDPSVNEEVNRYQLPTKGLGTHLTGEVAVGGGSVWVGHGGFNPGAWVERLDAETGRLQHRFSILGGDADHVAFAEGAVWVASSPSGELRKIDPKTNDPVFMRPLQAQLCCVAAGGGYVWAATNPEGKIWKVAANGSVLGTLELRSPVQGLTYADGALWAALGEEGTAVRIDPITDDIREYDLGHSVTSVDARAGLLAAGVRHGIEDVTGDLSGDVVWVGRKGDELFDSGAPIEPAFASPTWDAPQEMFHYMTCARLLNYPDTEGDAGRRLVPEVAEDFPEVSDGGRTFTFRIRKGFGFSPPSKEEVTAESFRHAVERAVKIAKLVGDDLRPPLTNIVGAQAYYAGRSPHISGVSADGDLLVIRFHEPEPDLPWLAASSTCAVPVDTPIVEGGLEKPVPSAGPYYLATLTDSLALLRPNPNYGGSRPQQLDAIVVEFNVPPAEAATRIENGTLDYFLESQGATLTPGTAAARTVGHRYHLVPYNRIQFYAFNYDRPLFADLQMRRAVQYTLDRRALVEASPGGSEGLPATRLLYPSIAGYDDTHLYPLRSNLRTARRLAAGRTGRVVVCCTFVGDAQYAGEFNRALRKQLAAIGLRMTMLWLRQGDSDAEIMGKARRSDLIWGGLNEHTADPAEYLKGLFLPPDDAKELRRIQTLFSPERERAAIALARKIERESLYAVFVNDAIPELVSRRLGCIVHQPEYAGVDLAALCLKDEHD